jgi:hypothetical protein
VAPFPAAAADEESFVLPLDLDAPAAEPAAEDSYALLADDAPAAAPADPSRLVVFVVDRSLADPFGGDPKSAYARLQERANELLSKLAAKPDPDVQVALTAYGQDATGQTEVRSGFEGALAGRPVVTAGELATGALRSEQAEEQLPDGIGGLLTVRRTKHTFLESDPAGACSPVPAFQEVRTILDIWGSEHPAPAKPPIVLHLTRGGHAEAELREATGLVAGAALYHLVATEAAHPSALFPAGPDGLEDPGLRLLWELSSPLQDAGAFAKNPAVRPGARGFVVNGKFDCLLPPAAV